MNIALVMEWSTSERNEIVSSVLQKVAEANGHTVVNYGQYNMEDHRQTYNQNAVFTAALLASGAADFVITGCGTGEGACWPATPCPASFAVWWQTRPTPMACSGGEYAPNNFGQEQDIGGTQLNMEFFAPVFAGDVLRGAAYVEEKQDRNPYNGMIWVVMEVYNQQDKLVLRSRSSSIILKRG